MVKADVARPYVEKLTRELLNTDELLYTEDGQDILVPFESALCRLSVLEGETTLVRAWSIIVEEIEGSAGLFEELNRINASVVSARIFWADGRVIVASEIPVAALDPEELRHLTWAVFTLANAADDKLAENFGGKVWRPAPPDGSDEVDV